MALQEENYNLRRELSTLRKGKSILRGENITPSHKVGFLLSDADLSKRLSNVLERHLPGITTITELANMPKDKLKKTPGLGKRCYNEIEILLSKFGY